MKTLQELRDEVQRDYETKAAVLDRIAPYYEALMTGLADVKPYVWVDGYEVNVSITGAKSALASAWATLRRNGFTPEERPTRETKSEIHTRFRQADGTRVYLAFSSTVCRRVQVGTRTVEEPIYEIQCEEQASTEEASPPAPEPQAQELVL